MRTPDSIIVFVTIGANIVPNFTNSGLRWRVRSCVNPVSLFFFSAMLTKARALRGHVAVMQKYGFDKDGKSEWARLGGKTKLNQYFANTGRQLTVAKSQKRKPYVKVLHRRFEINYIARGPWKASDTVRVRLVGSEATGYTVQAQFREKWFDLSAKKYEVSKFHLSDGRAQSFLVAKSTLCYKQKATISSN